MRRAGEACELEDRICTECGECEICELEPEKICDNCCKCIEGSGADFAAIQIDDILLDTEQLNKTSHKRKFHIKSRT